MVESKEENLKKKLKLNTIIICVLVALLLISVIILIVNISIEGVVSENNLSNLGMLCKR